MKVMKEKGSAKNAKKVSEMLGNIKFLPYYSTFFQFERNTPINLKNKIDLF